MVKIVDLELDKGDDYTIELHVTNKDTGADIDITDAEIRFSVKTDEDAAAYTFQKKNAAATGSDSEIKEIDGSGGRADIYILSADTLSLVKERYKYDVNVILANGKRKTVVKGALKLEKVVTDG